MSKDCASQILISQHQPFTMQDWRLGAHGAGGGGGTICAHRG